MLSFFLRRTRRQALQELVVELYHYNDIDYCFDPIGSVDKDGMRRIIEVIARSRQARESKARARSSFVINSRKNR